MTSTRSRTRLPSEVFDLPLDKMRAGYYSDAYFNYTKPLLEVDGHYPRVVDAGLPAQALGARRHGRGDRDPARVRRARGAGRRVADRLRRARGARALRRRRDRAVGDGDDDRGRLLALLPPRDGLPRRASRAARWSRRTSARSSTPRRASRSCSSPPATTTGCVQTGDGYAAHIAGAIGVSTDAQASWWGGRGVGTVPHGADRGLRRRHRARRAALRRGYARRHEHRRPRRLRQRLASAPRSRSPRARAAALGRAARHVDTMVDARCGRRWASSTRAASTRSSSGTCASALDEAGFGTSDRRVGRLHGREDPRVRGGRRAGRLLRRRLVADPRRERLHRRRRHAGRPRRREARPRGRANPRLERVE